MHGFKKILWAYEPDAGARDRMALLAAQHQAELTVAVFATPPAAAREDAEQELHKFVEDLQQRGLTVRTVTLGETSHAEITREVVEHQHDLVVMTERAEDSNSLFNSTAQKLMRTCPCGVWVDKPGRTGPLKRVLAAIDPSEGESRRGKLGKQVVNTAARVALTSQAELHVLNAWRPLARPAALGRVGTSPQEIESLVHEDQLLRQRLVDDVLRDCKDCLSGQPPVTHIVQGAPEIVLPELVASLDVDLLVIGTLGRTGIAGFFLGNFAESVLGAIDCAVLAVKSEDFVSPVKVS